MLEVDFPNSQVAEMYRSQEQIKNCKRANENDEVDENDDEI